MSRTLFTTQVGRAQMRIEVANRADLAFTLTCDRERNGSMIWLELPRNYQTARGAKLAAARIVGEPLQWETVDSEGSEDAVPELVMAALRDANWYARPNTRTPKRYHVVAQDDRPACGAPMLLCEPIEAERVDVILRCQRPGCKGRWPAPSE